MKITIQTPTGALEVEAEVFQTTIGSARFRFAVHNAYDAESVVVTHLRSGKCVCTVDLESIRRHRGDRASAARDALDMLVRRQGADALEAALHKSEGLPKETMHSRLVRFGLERRAK